MVINKGNSIFNEVNQPVSHKVPVKSIEKVEVKEKVEEVEKVVKIKSIIQPIQPVVIVKETSPQEDILIVTSDLIAVNVMLSDDDKFKFIDHYRKDNKSFFVIQRIKA